ncbi:3-hydroxyacyl-CoA dehydrogenase family protein [Sphingomonas sp. MMS24-JH45]
MGGGAAAARTAQWLRGYGYRVEVIADSPGFVLQRMLAMEANLGCELAQIGVGTPADIDTAMKLAQNYPLGPLEWGNGSASPAPSRSCRPFRRSRARTVIRPSLLRRRAREPSAVYGELMYGLLEGLTVVEGAAFIAGPSCGLHLAQMGATVIRFDQTAVRTSGRWPLSQAGTEFIGRA